MLEVDFGNVGFVHQYKLKSDGKWHSSHTRHYEINVNSNFILGTSHIFYDGPHCTLSIGWIHFNWCGNPRTGYCKKCEHPDIYVLHDETGNEIKGVYGDGLEWFYNWWEAFSGRRKLIKEGTVSRSCKIFKVKLDDKHGK